MEYYSRKAFSPDFGASHRRLETEDDISDDVYLDKMQRILSAAPCIGVPPEPSHIIGNVYVGTSANAENIPLLKSMRITFLLNCAGSGSSIMFRKTKEMYPEETGIMGYSELLIEDTDDPRDARSLQFQFQKANAFINYARDRNAKVLVYCPGVSRSGAVALSYLMSCGRPLLVATRMLKDARRCALTNETFMAELIKFGRDKGCLDPELESVHAPKYFQKLNRYRIYSAHLPTFRQDL